MTVISLITPENYVWLSSNIACDVLRRSRLDKILRKRKPLNIGFTRNVVKTSYYLKNSGANFSSDYSYESTEYTDFQIHKQSPFFPYSIWVITYWIHFDIINF